MGKTENTETKSTDISRLRGRVGPPAVPPAEPAIARLDPDKADEFYKILMGLNDSFPEWSRNREELWNRVRGMSPADIDAEDWGHYDSKTSQVYWIGKNGLMVVSMDVGRPESQLLPGTIYLPGMNNGSGPDFHGRQAQVAALILEKNGWSEEAGHYSNLAELYFHDADNGLGGPRAWKSRPPAPR